MTTMFAPRIDKRQTHGQTHGRNHGASPRRTMPHSRPATTQQQALQRQHDRAVLGRVLTPRLPAGVQAKLSVGAVNDPLEHEADRVADQVLRMPASDVAVARAPVQVSRKCAACDHEDTELRRSPSGDDVAGVAAPALVHEVLQAPGTPLDAGTRNFFEPRFGVDLSAVRVHTDAKAAQSAEAVQAQAYTSGSAIVFGRGQYSPATAAGQRLLAHELTHTLQQAGGTPAVQRQPLFQTGRAPRWQARLMGAESLPAFALNSASLTRDHQDRLRILAYTLKSLLADYRTGAVLITGHTDATGGEELNLRLGQQRADAVADFLMELGLPAGALVSLSAGETQLRVATRAQEPRNRRVEVRFDPAAPRLSQPESEPTPDAQQTTEQKNLDGSQICKTRPDLCEGRPPRGTPISTQLPQRCPNELCGASAYKLTDQPRHFKKLLDDSFGDGEHWFATLGLERRVALVAIYNRLCALGLACRIVRIESVIAGEAPVSVAGVHFKVPGLSVSVNFVTDSNTGMFDALALGGISCRDAGAGGALHPGQTSLRQRTPEDGLHSSLGSDDRADAHLDIYSSPALNSSSVNCIYDVPATAAHLGREIVPEKVRGFLKDAAGARVVRDLPVIPYLLETLGAGFQVLPDSTLTPTVQSPEPPRGDAAPPPLAGWTWRGPVPAPRQPLVPPELKVPKTDLGRLTDQTLEDVRRILEQQVPSDALFPPQLRARLNQARRSAEQAGPDEEGALRAARDRLEQQAEFTDAHDIGTQLAIDMARARLRGQASVMLDLASYGNYGGLDAPDRAILYKQIHRLALIVRAAIPESVAGVNSIVVLFGSGTPGQIQLPP